MNHRVLGFNGERIDPVSGTTHLGNGYRAYNPVLMRFNCPDSLSPFDAGGINAYVYCTNDPVNQADPSGYFSLGQDIGMALGLLAGIALGIVTEGAAMPAVLTLMATVAGDAVIGADSELVTEAVDRHRVNWGQVGIAAGLGVATTLAGYGLGMGSKLKGISNRPFGSLMIEQDMPAATANVSTGTLYTTYANMELARNTEINRGFGNCEYVAKRAFKTLLTGSSSRSHPFKETLTGIAKYADNLFPFRRMKHPAELYESMLRKVSISEGPFPEINTITFSSKSSMENSLKKTSPFSVFYATSTGSFMGIDTKHAFVIARGEKPEEYYIFDRFNATSHHVATNEPNRYFDYFNEFEVELTGFFAMT